MWQVNYTSYQWRVSWGDGVESIKNISNLSPEQAQYTCKETVSAPRALPLGMELTTTWAALGAQQTPNRAPTMCRWPTAPTLSSAVWLVFQATTRDGERLPHGCHRAAFFYSGGRLLMCGMVCAAELLLPVEGH